MSRVVPSADTLRAAVFLYLYGLLAVLLLSILTWAVVGHSRTANLVPLIALAVGFAQLAVMRTRAASPARHNRAPTETRLVISKIYDERHAAEHSVDVRFRFPDAIRL